MKHYAGKCASMGPWLTAGMGLDGRIRAYTLCNSCRIPDSPLKIPKPKTHNLNLDSNRTIRTLPLKMRLYIPTAQIPGSLPRNAWTLWEFKLSLNLSYYIEETIILITLYTH